MKKRFTKEQIIMVLKEQEASGKTAEVCRRHGISAATFYKWKAKYGGMEVCSGARAMSVTSRNCIAFIGRKD